MKRFSSYSKVSIAAFSLFALTAVGTRADSGAAPLIVSAPTPGEMTRIARSDNINLRSRPSATAEIVGQLKKGTKVQVRETKSVTEAGKSRDWLRIALPASTKCYVNSQLLKDGAATTDAVNVRCGPGTSFKEIGKLAKGEKVDVIKTEGEWIQIKPTAHCFGWVAAEFLEIVPTIAPAPPVMTTTIEVVTPPVTAPVTAPVPVPVPEVRVETRTIEVPVEVMVQYQVKDGIFQKVQDEAQPLTPYELATPSIEGRQYRITYLELKEATLEKFLGKHVRVVGNERWRKGDRYPVMVVERIDIVW